jgi:ABC-type sugar transport system substrate-binding protein
MAIAGVTSSSAASKNGPPYVYHASWGTFHLSPAIASKISGHQTLNIGLSMEGQTIPIYGPQYKYGFGVGVKKWSKVYGVPVHGVFLGPVTADPTTQLNQLRSALATNSVDCLTVEGGGNPAFAPLIDQAIASGIPVFTVGTDILQSHRFATFHTIWTEEGGLDADAMVKYFKAHNITLKQAWMTTGDVSAPFAQARMSGFMTELKKLVPSVTFLDTPSTAPNTGFDPATVYNDAKSFLAGHSGIQAVYQTDAGAEFVDKAIVDLGLKGKVFTSGENVDLTNLNYIQTGVQVSTIDQNYPAQSAYPVHACLAFLLQGKILPNNNTPGVITAANVQQARRRFIATGGTLPLPTPKK